MPGKHVGQQRGRALIFGRRTPRRPTILAAVGASGSNGPSIGQQAERLDKAFLKPRASIDRTTAVAAPRDAPDSWTVGVGAI